MRRALIVLLSLLACVAFHSPAATAAGARAALELAESRPAETALGNPDLPEARAVWLAMIARAHQTLDLEHFYLSHKRGESLQPVLDAIGAAAARGVRVRLLLDAAMSRTYPQPADSLDGLANIEVRRVDYRRLAGGVQHAKFMLVDDREAWLGSQNLDWRALSQIHELGVLMRDRRLVGAVASVFAADWAGADTTRAFAPGSSPVRQWPLVVQQPNGAVQAWLGASPRATNPAGIPWDRDLIVERILAAKQEIVVQVLQYGLRAHGETDSTLHRALLDAAARGVKVRLIVSDWALGGANEAALRDLAAHAGVEVRVSRVADWSVGYIPFGRVEHCKFMVTDSQWLWVGTSNWEPSYFLTTRNLGLTVHDARLAGQVHRTFETSWNAPSATPFLEDTKLPPRTHGMEAPAGMKVYGE